MAWRTVATVVIVVFVAVLTWTVLADPLVETGEDFKGLDPKDGDQIDPSTRIDEMIGGFFDMFLILVFGVMGWGLWRIFRKEITRGGGGGL